MPVKTLKDFLDRHGVKYVSIVHSPAFTAREIAASAHISGQLLAKTVIVKVDGRIAMAVLPANEKVDFELLRATAGAERVELASEWEFNARFEGCEVGAMPPFGNLYDMEVFVAADLARGEEIAFNAGSHTELIRLAYRDFENLVHPRTMQFATRG
jgi:Ala-tRNA(Pro) deacylase